MNGYLSNPLAFIISFIFSAYAGIVLLRFLLQLTRADFYNPLSQFIIKATSPVLAPMRHYIPSVKGLDTSSLLLAWIVKAVELLLVTWLKLGAFSLGWAILGAIPGLVELAINIFLYAIIIQAILSWVHPGDYHPAANLLHALTAPILRPIQRVIPIMGGLDISPMVAILGLMVLKMLVLPPLNQLVLKLIA